MDKKCNETIKHVHSFTPREDDKNEFDTSDLCSGCSVKCCSHDSWPDTLPLPRTALFLFVALLVPLTTCWVILVCTLAYRFCHFCVLSAPGPKFCSTRHIQFTNIFGMSLEDMTQNPNQVEFRALTDPFHL